MNNSTAICNVKGTYRSHPCRFDKGGKKICISTVRTDAASPAFQRTPVSQLKELSLYVPHRSRPQSHKDNLLLFPHILFLFFLFPFTHMHTPIHTHILFLSDYSRYICNRLTCDLQSEGGKKEEHILLGGFILHLLYKCIKYAIVNVIKDRPECHYV